MAALSDLEDLRVVARELGIEALGCVAVDDSRFEPSYRSFREFLEGSREGEMGFLGRASQARVEPKSWAPEAESIWVGVVPYTGEPGPIARYAQWEDYHRVLYRRFELLAERLEERFSVGPSRVCVDTKPLLERSAAALAGVGKLGKNGCLIVPGLGSYVLIGALMSPVKLGDDLRPRVVEGGKKPLDWQVCGSCRACLDACPTDAFEAPGRLDPRRCIAYLTIEHRGEISGKLQDGLGERVVGCDRCQEVCPHNQSALRPKRISAEAALEYPSSGPKTESLAEIASLGSAAYRRFVRGTPIDRLPRRALRRNALIAIGNVRGPLTEAEKSACERGVEDPDPQIQAAGRRALRRRGAQDSESGLEPGESPGSD